MKKNILFLTILFGLFVFVFSGCGFNTQKNAEPAANTISEELHQAHCDLLSKANEELAGINQKVRTLNDVIREKNVKFTDDQNKALDDFEAKQASINKRMHEIKNIKQDDWENFKSTFDKDLEEINMVIDNIIKEL
jgi:uncharacterized protein YoxC